MPFCDENQIKIANVYIFADGDRCVCEPTKEVRDLVNGFAVQVMAKTTFDSVAF